MKTYEKNGKCLLTFFVKYINLDLMVKIRIKLSLDKYYEESEGTQRLIDYEEQEFGKFMLRGKNSSTKLTKGGDNGRGL